MVNQMAELAQTVCFQEHLINRLLTYLPASTSEYIPEPSTSIPAPALASALIYVLTAKPKPNRSLSSDTIERVELGLLKESELRKWREEPKLKAPSTSKKTSTRSHEDARCQQEDKPKYRHRSHSRSLQGYVFHHRSRSREHHQRSPTPRKS